VEHETVRLPVSGRLNARIEPVAHALETITLVVLVSSHAVTAALSSSPSRTFLAFGAHGRPSMSDAWA
jgi:hypothetical protein